MFEASSPESAKVRPARKEEMEDVHKSKKHRGAMFADASAFASILEAAGDQNEGLNSQYIEWEGGKQTKKRY